MSAHDEQHILVLAAGRGRRMGIPKVLMPVGQTPWWQRQHDALAATNFSVTWVVSQSTAQTLSEINCQFRFAIACSDAPMFQSVFAGLKSLKNRRPKGVFILPVDVPAPDPVVWQLLADTDALAIPIFREAPGHPVYLPWPWIMDNDLLNPNLAPSRRLDELIRPHAIRVPVDDPTVLVNINTPEDLERWEASQQP